MRLLAKSFNVPGDHVGQASTGYRWPFGPVAIVSTFNYPLGEPTVAQAAAPCFKLYPTHALFGVKRKPRLQRCIYPFGAGVGKGEAKGAILSGDIGYPQWRCWPVCSSGMSIVPLIVRLAVSTVPARSAFPCD